MVPSRVARWAMLLLDVWETNDVKNKDPLGQRDMAKQPWDMGKDSYQENK